MKKTNKNNDTVKSTILNTIYTVLVLTVLAVLLLPKDLFISPTCDLDPSWSIALTIAWKENFIFGKDVVFTHGPLAVLCRRLPINVEFLYFLIYDLFLIFSILYFYFSLLRTRINKYLVFILLMPIFFLRSFNSLWSAEIVFILFIFSLLYYQLYRIDKPRIIFLVIPSIYALINFYTKANLGLISIFMNIAILLVLYFKDRKRVDIIVVLAIFLLSTYTFSFPLHVDIIKYISTSFSLIDGFNDAMYYAPDNDALQRMWLAIVSLSILLILLLVKFIMVLKKDRNILNYDFLIIEGFLVLGYFILFKQSFVRADSHTFQFYRFFSLSLLIILIPVFYDGLKFSYLSGAFLSVLIFSIIISATVFINGGKQEIFYTPAEPISKFLNYKKDYKRHKNFQYNVLCSILDEKVLSKIGNNSADILPIEISTIYLNHLKYNPRPVLQSYTAYNETLDNINAQKYESDTKPDYVLFSNSAIDGRLGFHDETATKLALLKNYQVDDYIMNNMFNQFILLKKRNTTINGKQNNILSSKHKLGKALNISETKSLQILKADIKYSLLGKLKRLFFQPPPLNIEITLEDGSVVTNQEIITNLKSGIIVNKYISNFDNALESALFFNSLGSKNKNVKSIKLITDQPWGFDAEFNCKLDSIVFDQKSNTDSIKYQEVRIKKQHLQQLKVNGNIERLEKNKYYTLIKGWAYIDLPNTDCCDSIYIYLYNKDRYFKVPTYMVKRLEIANQFGSGFKYLNTGFNSIIINTKIQPGIYKIGLSINNKDNNEEFVPISDTEIIL